MPERSDGSRLDSAGSKPSFSTLGCWLTGMEVNEVLGRFLPVGKARVGLALAGRAVWPLAGQQSLDM
jgi:hypothetical protein